MSSKEKKEAAGRAAGRIPVLLAVILAMLLMTGCGQGKKELSVSPYILVNVSGLSGRAGATVYLDTAGIYTALAGVNATEEERAVYDGFVASMQISADRVMQLANGDRVTVTVTYDAGLAQELKINVTDFVKSVEVSGLNEGIQIDLFKDFEVIVSGVAPYAFVTYVNNSADPYISKLEYVIEGKASGLSNGDVITVKCNMDPAAAELYYYYTDVTSMSYTVEGLDSYIYDPAQLDNQVLSEIAGECAQVIRADTDDTTTRMLYRLTGSSDYLYQDNNEWVDNLRLNQVIFMARSSKGSSPYENIIYFVFQAGIENNNYYEDGFFIFEYTNAIRSGTGEFLIGRNNPELRYVCGTDFDTIYNELTRDISYQYSSMILDGIALPENTTE